MKNLRQAGLIAVLTVSLAVVLYVLFFMPTRSKLHKVDGCGGTNVFGETASYKGLLYSDRRLQPEMDYYADCNGKLQLVRWYDPSDRKIQRVALVDELPKSIGSYHVNLEDGPLRVMNRDIQDARDRETEFEKLRDEIDRPKQ